MKKINVLEYLEASAKAYPEKIAAKDDKTCCTYRELEKRAKQIGTWLSKETAPGHHVHTASTSSFHVFLQLETTIIR